MALGPRGTHSVCCASRAKRQTAVGPSAQTFGAARPASSTSEQTSHLPHMRTQKPVLALLAAALAIAGCATTPTPEQDQQSVPDKQVYVKFEQSDPRNATVVVVRDQGALAALNFLHFFINDQRVASFETGERLVLHLKPGDYVLGVKPTDPFGVHAGFSIDQTLLAGRTYRYRLLLDGNAGTRIQRVP